MNNHDFIPDIDQSIVDEFCNDLQFDEKDETFTEKKGKEPNILNNLENDNQFIIRPVSLSNTTQKRRMGIDDESLLMRQHTREWNAQAEKREKELLEHAIQHIDDVIKEKVYLIFFIFLISISIGERIHQNTSSIAYLEYCGIRRL